MPKELDSRTPLCRSAPRPISISSSYFEEHGLVGGSPESVSSMRSYSSKKSKKAVPDIDPPRIVARNDNQRILLDKLKGDSPAIVVVAGCAGVGKTYAATIVGLHKLYDGSVRKIVITRPAVHEMAKVVILWPPIWTLLNYVVM